MSLSPFVFPDGSIHLTLSSGRTSAYLLQQLLEANGDLPERIKVIFANTGREDPRTDDLTIVDSGCAQDLIAGTEPEGSKALGLRRRTLGAIKSAHPEGAVMCFFAFVKSPPAPKEVF